MTNALSFNITRTKVSEDEAFVPKAMRAKLDAYPSVADAIARASAIVAEAKSEALGFLWAEVLNSTLEYAGVTYDVKSATDRRQELYSLAIQLGKTSSSSADIVRYTTKEGPRALFTEDKALLDALRTYLEPFDGISNNDIAKVWAQYQAQLV